MSLQHIPTHIALEMNAVGKMHKCFQMDFLKKICGSNWAVFWPLLNSLLPLHLMVGWLMIRWSRMASCTCVTVGCWMRWCWWLDHVFLIMKQAGSGFLWKMQDSKSWKRKQAPIPKGFLYCNCYCSIGHNESYGQPLSQCGKGLPDIGYKEVWTNWGLLL